MKPLFKIAAYSVFLAMVCLICSQVDSEELPAKKDAAVKKPKFEIVQFGTFAAGPSRLKGEHNSDFIEEVRLISTTNQIPLKMGERFGIVYMCVESPSSAHLTVVSTLVHPPITDPKTGDIYYQDRVVYSLSPSKTAFHMWSFKSPFELVPGSYTFRVFHDGEKVLEKEFLVSAPSETSKNKSEK